jgi:NADPH-dependent 2,4-dienoyl-CoA reductase/sulfur reductase-like enzyme
MKNIVVIGGGAAGMSAASRVRKLLPDSSIKVFEESLYVSYAPCGVPYYVEDTVRDINELVTYTPEFFIKERNIDVHTRTHVNSVDLGASEVSYVSEEGEGSAEFDYLIMATGAVPFVPVKKWLENDNVYTVRHLEDGERIKANLSKAKSVAVVGGGYIGVEMAEALSKQGKRVTVLEMKRIMPGLDPEMSSIISNYMKSKGVVVKEGFEVKSIENSSGSVLISNGGESERFDAALLALGVRPNVELAKSMGLRLGETGAIWVDDFLKTSNERIFAAGDNIEVKDVVLGKKRYVPLAPEANKEGYVVGSNLAGMSMVFPGSAGAAITKFYDLEIGSVGINEEEAKASGIDYYAVKIKHNSRASYFPPRESIDMKVIFDKKKKVPLGAQLVGGQIFGRLSVLSLAVSQGIDSEKLFFSGIPYAPPFAPVWDSVIVASRIINEHVL